MQCMKPLPFKQIYSCSQTSHNWQSFDHINLLIQSKICSYTQNPSSTHSSQQLSHSLKLIIYTFKHHNHSNFIQSKTTTTQPSPNITCLTILSNTSSTQSIKKWHRVKIQVLQTVDNKIEKLNALQFTASMVCKHVLWFPLHHRIVMQCFSHAGLINASFGNGLQPKLSYTLAIVTRQQIIKI